MELTLGTPDADRTPSNTNGGRGNTWVQLDRDTARTLDLKVGESVFLTPREVPGGLRPTSEVPARRGQELIVAQPTLSPRTLEVAALSLRINPAASRRASRRRRNALGLGLERGGQPVSQALERKCPVANLGTLVFCDDADLGAEPLEQPGALARP